MHETLFDRFARAFCALILCLGVLPVADGAEVVYIPDPKLEQAVRSIIRKPTGDILDTDMAAVTESPELNEYHIADLTGVEYFINVPGMNLAANEFSDITPLLGLDNLEKLSLGCTNVTDFSPLATMANLRTLHVGGDPMYSDFSDITSLAALHNLTSLSIGMSQVEDVTPLAGLTNLEMLHIWFNQVSDVSPLAGLSNLTTLSLNVNHITDISPLATLGNLEVVNLGNRYREAAPGNHIVDLSPLAGLTSLRHVEGIDCSVTDISFVSGLLNLEYIDLSGNLVTDLEPLVANTEFRDGDTMHFRGNPLTQDTLCTDAPLLRARGVYGSMGSICGEPPPVIVQQPAGGWVEVGQSHTFSVEVAGKDGVSCWWRKDGVVVGLRYPELTIRSVSPEDAGWYTCLVVHGNGTTMSAPAYLDVVAEGSLPSAGFPGLLVLAGILCAAGAVTWRARRRAKSVD